jgi:hypothetical protein
MALEAIKGPTGTPDAGIFNLPPNFDRNKFAAEWVEEDQVPFKRQRQTLPQTGMTADGWEPYKMDGAKHAFTVVSGNKKKYVLMVRPREIQDQVNALFGNVSKKQIRREQTGETVAGAAPQDPGMLTEQRLRSVAGEGSMAGEEADLQPNKIGGEDDPAHVGTTAIST